MRSSISPHDGIHKEQAQLLQRSDDNGALTVVDDQDIFKDKSILVTLSALPHTPSDAPNLQLVHFCSSGTDHIAGHPVYADSTIPLTTCRGIHGPPISEWVIMTALVHSHRYNFLHHLQKEQQWDRQDYLTRVRDMVGQRIGILGYGGIGRQGERWQKLSTNSCWIASLTRSSWEGGQGHGHGRARLHS
jgi:phosphoglycerate dehydrogenase-like enzyme